MSVQMQSNRLTIRELGKKKGKERLAMLTAYDVMTARLLDEAGVDFLLVGDSMGNVVYGFDSTLPVTLDMMLAHTGAVVRGSKRALVIADLPFLTYQVSVEEAIRNAGRCLAEAGAQAVKVEGANDFMISVVKRLVETGIPVVGHIGLTPQSVHQMGGFYKHGKTEVAAERLVKEAKALSAAGAFAIVLECVEEGLAAQITKEISALTIGIGSGRVCDGEVLVVNDILGYSVGGSPKFAREYADVAGEVRRAAAMFVNDTKGNSQRQRSELTQ